MEFVWLLKRVEFLGEVRDYEFIMVLMCLVGRFFLVIFRSIGVEDRYN